jgi:hypothetical protein
MCLFSSSLLLRHTSDISIPVNRNFPSMKDVAKHSRFQLFPPSTPTSSNVNSGLEQKLTGNSAPIVDQLC